MSKETETAVVKRQVMDVMDMSDSMYSRLEHQAEIMSSSKVTVPDHLKGSKGDCMAIIIQAKAWGMQPLQVAQATHLINGKLGYEAKLVNAVLCSSGAIKGRPHYSYKGDWSGVEGKPGPTWGQAEEGLSCVVTCTMSDGTEEEWECLLSSCKVRNSPNWKNGKAKLQMAYQAIKEWSRVHAPDAILGVSTDDELPQANLTPISPLPTGPSKTNALADLIDGDEEDDEVVVPEVQVMDAPSTKKKATPKKKAVAPPKKDLVLESEKETEDEYHKKLMEAVASTELPLSVVIEYCTANGGLKGSENLADLPKKWKEGIIKDPANIKNAINAWLDED